MVSSKITQNLFNSCKHIKVEYYSTLYIFQAKHVKQTNFIQGQLNIQMMLMMMMSHNKQFLLLYLTKLCYWLFAS